MRLKIMLTLLILLSISFEVFADRSLHCMAQNVYFEAASESFIGQIAVAQVVMNRVKSPDFPDTPCDVIQEGPSYISARGNILPIKHACQFSWYCDGKVESITDRKSWDIAVNVSMRVLLNTLPDITEGSMWYHNTSVEPYWAITKHKVTQIDNHIFYSP